MSRLDEAMLEHMAYIVFSEHRPFYVGDFLDFEVDGNKYHMTAGTYRNKISRLMKSGVVELDYNSGTAFHTLIGHKFGKLMTATHAVGKSHSNDPIVRMIQKTQGQKRSA